MCECGCGGTGKRWSIPGPDCDIYVIHQYFGCDYCSSPFGVDIEYIPIDHQDFDFYNEYPDLPMDNGELLPTQAFLGFFSKDDIKLAFTQYISSYFKGIENVSPSDLAPFDQVEAESIFEDFIDEFWKKINDKKRKST
jgi:hypothetical protein